jgi:hypothetical protein
MRVRIGITAAVVVGSLIAVHATSDKGISLRNRRRHRHDPSGQVTSTTTTTSMPGSTSVPPPPASSTPTSPATTPTTPSSSGSSTSVVTVAPTTVAAPPTTSTGTNTTVGTVVPSGNCGLAAPVFCETFDGPAGNGGRTGDLNQTLWGVSRVGNINPGQFVDDVAQVSVSGCGTSAWVMAPADVRVCDGMMFEAVNDGGGVAGLHTYPKQPFDFAGRTGRVTFDVSADSEGSHGAWPEFVITDKPVPGTRVAISGVAPPVAMNEVGFSLTGCGLGGGGTLSGVGAVFVSRNGVYAEVPFTTQECVTKGSARALNHFEVRVSQSRLEVWGTDAGSSSLKMLGFADGLGLTFSKGLVWLDDVHYNARKAIEPCECGTQWNHTFVWDNLGFDGPRTYRDLGFDVADANVPGNPPFAGDPSVRVGYQVGTGPMSFPVAGVRHDQTPTGAIVVFNFYSFGQAVPSVSVNGNAPVATAWPSSWASYAWNSIAVPIPLAQVHDGTNTITFTSPEGSMTVANISLILIAGAPIP